MPATDLWGIRDVPASCCDAAPPDHNGDHNGGGGDTHGPEHDGHNGQLVPTTVAAEGLEGRGVPGRDRGEHAVERGHVLRLKRRVQTVGAAEHPLQQRDGGGLGALRNPIALQEGDGGRSKRPRMPYKGPQRRLDRRLEEVAKAVGGGYRRLHMPLKLALGVRGTVAGHRLGALEGSGGHLSLFQCNTRGLRSTDEGPGQCGTRHRTASA